MIDSLAQFNILIPLLIPLVFSFFYGYLCKYKGKKLFISWLILNTVLSIAVELISGYAAVDWCSAQSQKICTFHLDSYSIAMVSITIALTIVGFPLLYLGKKGRIG